MKRCGIVLVACTLWHSPVAGQSGGADYQLRPLFHVQAVADGSENGVAVWAIVPDSVKPDPFRVLGLAGFVRRSDRGWLELMGGGFVSEGGSFDPVFNLRAIRRAGRTAFYAEAMHTFPRERFLVSFAATVAVPVGKLKLGIGAESDLAWRPDGKSFAGAGPRLVVPVPFVKNASLATAYQWQSGRSFLRHYLLVNF